MSTAFGTTLHTAPGQSESQGHQMLQRAAMVRQVAQGIFAYLPFGWRTVRKIEAVLRAEMERIGCQEISMPVVNPADLWKQSGRYTGIGPELARFADRRGRDMVLAMTHEEIVTSLARSEIGSYRDLPRMVFQLQTKFRDDARPRAGLLRVREFTMKDAYSFDRDEEGLARQYRAQYQAYFTIFKRCGVPIRAVLSDVGMMGGSMAHEFMYITPIGEDTLLLCDACGFAANREVATFRKPSTASEAVTVHHWEGGGKLVTAVLRADTELNETKLANLVHASGPRDITVVDDAVQNTGYKADIIGDITAARAGDPCPECGHALRTTRGVEAGNIFKLGTKYSADLGAVFVDADGERRPLIMGCYGIGVGRLLGCAAEEHHDDKGLRLPASIAPYHVHLALLDDINSEVGTLAQRYYDELWAHGIEVLLDDRTERPGVKFADADVIGLPLRLTLGKKGFAAGTAELRDRATGATTTVPLDNVVTEVRNRIAAMLTTLAAPITVDLPAELR
ncbi:aminoacyl--tRNA ligase-related protein [Actinoplanes sp. N902-109]|uniref:aminoacyl--tRNA ligase-related protein n=1 Tax=Actinoplanes sp. (strain N902-109) TaxID=649831 RepID=UPI0005A2C865|nr:aminoacyl--tRNA ligase-related protein [Actinoplanes sp. N902-109]